MKHTKILMLTHELSSRNKIIADCSEKKNTSQEHSVVVGRSKNILMPNKYSLYFAFRTGPDHGG